MLRAFYQLRVSGRARSTHAAAPQHRAGPLANSGHPGTEGRSTCCSFVMITYFIHQQDNSGGAERACPW